MQVNAAEPFVWTSGLCSPLYCDCRQLISHVDARERIVSQLCELIGQQRLAVDVVGGTATAAIPWAALLAGQLGVPMIYVRPQPKSHGAKRQVEGAPARGARTLIVEDLISTGSSALASVRACVREYAACVLGVVSIVNYDLAASRAAFEEADVPYWSLVSATDIIDQLGLPETDKASVDAFRADPAAWSDGHTQKTA